MTFRKKRVLAVASAGGHWIQLLRLRPAFHQCEIVYASTSPGNSFEVEGFDFFYFKNATRKTFWNFFVMIFQIIAILRKVKPDTIITTGSAPGLMTIAIGKLFRIKTVWIDSIANVDELSTSGKKARYFADLYLTQWEHLSKQKGPYFKGAVL